ncbi:hypothetical protein CC1G_13778 [Coprinopsis cinerea okayama7|uniref:Uncharacterized protein n=1 Tax=Coprinopsis cinerea (strain Okayama-7 / 130 / ATCC MYA-4618 / FGSC 9003) TaxID=240176 RepID=D6RKC5_COPC7|nr:hypothetical protein CC1G_13778 [Coprinopsis cinerea okayama7\|eukprot:XP_002912246.1 hypothetical protein CC1G_13778 [Coprinopsis cinerea okayama7\
MRAFHTCIAEKCCEVPGNCVVLAQLFQPFEGLKYWRTVAHSTLALIIQFMTVMSRIKDDILLVQPSEMSTSEAPQHLSSAIVLFLSTICSIPEPAERSQRGQHISIVKSVKLTIITTFRLRKADAITIQVFQTFYKSVS